MSIDAAPLAKPPRKPKEKRASKHLAGPNLIPDLIQTALGAKTFRQATRSITEEESDSLSRVLRMPVEEWRAEFAAQLRAAGSELLADLRARKDELKAGEIAYSLAVVVDKGSALDGRSQVNSASVNIQVNNYGSSTKDDLLASLQGRNPLKQPLEPQSTPSQSFPEPITQTPQPSEPLSLDSIADNIRECKV